MMTKGETYFGYCFTLCTDNIVLPYALIILFYIIDDMLRQEQGDLRYTELSDIVYWMVIVAYKTVM